MTVRPEDIDLDAIQQRDELLNHLPAGGMRALFFTWTGQDVAHLTDNGSSSLCGQAPDLNRHAVLFTGLPLGKPRCQDCLACAGIPLAQSEPRPYAGNPPGLERPTPAAEQKLSASQKTPVFPPEIDRTKSLGSTFDIP